MARTHLYMAAFSIVAANPKSIRLTSWGPSSWATSCSCVIMGGSLTKVAEQNVF